MEKNRSHKTSQIQEKKTIVWITPDWFFDVDWPIVDRLVDYYDIKWFVIWSKESNRQKPDNPNIYKFIQLSYRGRDPRIMWVYYKLISVIKSLHPMAVYNGYDGDPYFYRMAFAMMDRNLYIMEGHEPNPYRRRYHTRLMVKCLTWDINHVGHVHIFSKFTEKEFRKMYPNTGCTYIPMVPKDYGRPSEHLDFGGKKVFLFFGGVRPDKRLDVLLRAFVSMSDECQKKAYLLVYGSCEENKIQEYNEIVKGSNNIELHFGFASDEIVSTLFTSSDYLVLPYQVVTQSGPNMIAYYYNLPIIASNLDGFTERITDGIDGYIFPVNDVTALKDVLEKCINQTEEEYDMIKTNMARRVNDEYSVDVVIGKYKQMIDYVINKNKKVK